MLYKIGFFLELCATIAFSAFTLYALIQGNTHSVRAACPNLWEFMVARSAAAVVVVVLLGSLYTYIYYNFGAPDNKNPEWAKNDRNSPFPTRTMMYALWFVSQIYFAAFFAAGVAIIPSNVPNSKLCSDTLSLTVITGTPMLGIVAWIACGMDACLTVSIAVLFAYYACVSPRGG